MYRRAMEERRSRRHKGNGQKEKPREPDMYNPAQGGGRQALARRGPGRPRGRQQLQEQQNITVYFGHMQSQNENEKGNLSLWGMNMPLLYV